VGGDNLDSKPDLGAALAALRRDYSKLLPRIRVLEHTISCESDGVTLRVHYPSFRQGKATVQELTDSILHYLMHFALPRKQVADLDALYGTASQEDFTTRFEQLSKSARDLFKLANKATNRNGEGGELLLYLFTEWVLAAPQLIAKMSLKTNSEMPVHGADGVHVRYCAETARLILYWGESKLYADVGSAISAAVGSMAKSLEHREMKHEIDLVQRNIDFSGLNDTAKQAFLRYLDPYEENYNERHDVITCLIGFDFDAFGLITASDADEAENKFAEFARTKLAEIAPSVAKKVKAADLVGRPIEIFFFPVPSVQEFRDIFQAKIGWTQ
jgi:hypothetical protein